MGAAGPGAGERARDRARVPHRRAGPQRRLARLPFLVPRRGADAPRALHRQLLRRLAATRRRALRRPARRRAQGQAPLRGLQPRAIRLGRLRLPLGGSARARVPAPRAHLPQADDRLRRRPRTHRQVLPLVQGALASVLRWLQHGRARRHRRALPVRRPSTQLLYVLLHTGRESKRPCGIQRSILPAFLAFGGYHTMPFVHLFNPSCTTQFRLI